MRISTLLLLSFLFSINISSQNIFWGFELYGGISNYYNKPSSVTDYKFKESYGATLLLEMNIKNNTFFQSGFGYLNNGNKLIVDDISAYDKTVNSQNYLRVPLNFRFKELTKSKKLTITTGLYYSYLLSRIRKSEGYSREYEISWNDKTNDIKELNNLNRHDLGLNVELNRVFVSTDKFNIGFGLYGMLGLLPTIKNSTYKFQNYSFGFKTIICKK
nr:outer membrane beta-barrel protein [uncultured Carboxylicivirga sp.]